MPLLRSELVDQTLILHISDASTRNALSLELARELRDRIQKLDFRGLLVTHDGPYFCSGGQLKFYKSLKSKDEGLKVNQEIAEALEALDRLPVAKACFVDGVCLGGGVELLSCFDHVVASPQSLFGLWQRRVGLSYGWGGGERLARRISKKHLNRWLLGAETKDVYSSKAIGLVDQIQLAQNGLLDCFRWVQRCHHFGTESLGCILDANQSEKESFTQLWLGESHMKALQRFE